MYRWSKRVWNKLLDCKIKTTIYVSRDEHDQLWVEEHVEMSCPHAEDDELAVIPNFAGDREVAYAR